MSYLVMETKRSYAVLLDQEGRFLKAANLHYQVGQTVTDPVLLREKSEKGRLIPLFAGAGRLWRLWPPAWYSLSSSPCTSRPPVCTPPSI